MSVLILGISAFFHDSSASLVRDGKILAAAQEERFTREKNTSSFPINAIKFCLESNGYNIGDIDALIFYEKPFLKFERILETHLNNAPYSWRTFVKALPSWLHYKLLMNKTIKRELKILGDVKDLKILYSEHHLSHAASAYYCSPFNDAIILTIDGVGEKNTTSIFHGEGNKIKLLKEFYYPNSLGLFYSAVTYFLGFKVNSGEYKVMGLAPYGNKNSNRFKEFTELIQKNLFLELGTEKFILNLNYFSFDSKLSMIDFKKWENLFLIKKRIPESELNQDYCDFALAAQCILEDLLVKLVMHCKLLEKSENLCLAGGVALNCSAMGRIDELNYFKNIFIQPASGDAGGSLGAALAANYIYFSNHNNFKNNDFFSPYLGPEYTHRDLVNFNNKKKLKPKLFTTIIDHAKYLAEQLSKGKIIGLYQGRMEFGPRALGNRSILADPRSPEMLRTLNLSIKKREGFRPFAPVLLEEDYSLFFGDSSQKPYMTFAKKILSNYQFKSESELTFHDKIHAKRSHIPAVTHVDFTSRIQTVNLEQNEFLFLILQEFKKITGIGVLINTSFNQRGEPIVCSPMEAYDCFNCTDIDILSMGNFVYSEKLESDVQITLKFKLD